MPCVPDFLFAVFHTWELVLQIKGTLHHAKHILWRRKSTDFLFPKVPSDYSFRNIMFEILSNSFNYFWTTNCNFLVQMGIYTKQCIYVSIYVCLYFCIMDTKHAAQLVTLLRVSELTAEPQRHVKCLCCLCVEFPSACCLHSPMARQRFKMYY